MINQTKRYWKVLGILLLVILVLPLVNCDETPKPPPPPTNQCTCTQYNLICTEGVSTCWASPCQRVDYKDGKCFLYDSVPIPQPLRATVAESFDLSLSSYEGAIKTGSGGPDEKSWAMIAKDAPSEDIAKTIKAMTNDFLYISLGNDFKALTIEGPWGACEVASVPNKEATLALVDAVKQGTMFAIEKGNPSEVKAPINAFFKQYPDYKPNNPGYCYSEKNPGTSADCIGDALEQRLGLLVASN